MLAPFPFRNSKYDLFIYMYIKFLFLARNKYIYIYDVCY